MTQENKDLLLKERKEVLDNILAEFEEFGITVQTLISKDYTIVNFRVWINSFFFDFRINLNTNRLILDAYTHKQLTSISCVRECTLSMANIDELIMAIKSYENVHVPKFK